MTDIPTDIDRINALTNNARNTWFALLGALVFVGITLMGVEHIDFYGVDRETDLPLINVSVPTRFFFYAAPLLIAAIFGYFHLYLIRLWDALSVAEPCPGGKPLGDVITPWLVTDAALHLRTWLRKDGCTTPRTMEGGAMLLNLLLAWVFGLVILAWLWWASMTAREFLMTAMAAIALSVSIFCGGASFFALWDRMTTSKGQNAPQFFLSFMSVFSMLVVLLGVVPLSHQRTAGNFDRLLAPISITDGVLVTRSPDWTSYDVALIGFQAEWCKRASISPCILENQFLSAAFQKDWKNHRDSTISRMTRPSWSTRSATRKPNFNAANLSNSFLVGANFRNVSLVKANLSGAQLEGADFFQANLGRSNLNKAQLETANFFGASLKNAAMNEVILTKANLFDADLSGTDLNWAELIDADFGRANLNKSSLFRANLTGVSLRRAKIRDAKLTAARIIDADLIGADLNGSSLQYAIVSGRHGAPLQLRGTNLHGVKSHGTAIRHADLTGIHWNEQTDFRNSFLDATVERTTAFEAQMRYPCQWLNVTLSDEEFYQIWQWWIDQEALTRWSKTTFQIDKSIYNGGVYIAPTPERLAELGLYRCIWNRSIKILPEVSVEPDVKP